MLGLGAAAVVPAVTGFPVRALRAWWALMAALLLGSAASYLYTTRRGKFAVWADVLDELGLRGDEQVLDLGCGRGAVLLAAAQRLHAGGRAVGVDLWRSVDQSGNLEAATAANARAEGVADRVELRTADLTDLPFRDGEFDVVLSSLAIHNIPTADGRASAVAEAVRVLRPGGRLAIADIQHVPAYADQLRHLGLAPQVRPLGPRAWYGGPWMATSLVTATRPA
ncbi:Methyltransferase domain-containing protein [Pseudonocardia thermophila]|jgi:Methylase involved in ubiquinone/menaquinone biosynthesis|uniref:Methyltransferase domain-containing protein n=2 Tax=Pseudonocardia thermophila TaxID=1848 RepID=A0A1M6QJQ5_PSETH|nr:Methyltransferase domain-containing protein [Pseudonocardia thermophila]